MQDYGIDHYHQNLRRVCKECRRQYTVREYLENAASYFSRPSNYRAGCENYCLNCWLCIGPHDCPDEKDDDVDKVVHFPSASDGIPMIDGMYLGEHHDNWPYEEVCELLMQGDVLRGFQWFLERGANLALMPIARVYVDRPVVFPSGITFYPPGVADIEALNLIPNRDDTTSLAERCSAASGITAGLLNEHPLVVFPYQFDWNAFRSSGHESHLDLIRCMSEEIDRRCLNLARYRLCRLERADDVPAHAGQLASSPMMAGAMLYGSAIREARIVGGAVFTHYLTRGLGLPLEQIEWDQFPKEGEVGQIVNHALALYAAVLESGDPTARFMQCLGLLEFLAYPDEYRKFEEVKKVIARYVARDRTEYQRILNRFFELTGRKDPDTGRIIGYRTRVVHMGERLERLIPNPKSRNELFSELDGYIRPVIDHMILHSEKRFEEYLDERGSLRPFDRDPEGH